MRRFEPALLIATIVALLVCVVLLLPSTPVQAQTPRGPWFSCSVINDSTATLVRFTASKFCPSVATPGQALYITDISASSSVISSATADNYPVIKYGTGTNCATGTTVVWASYSLAFTPVIGNFVTPIPIPQNVDLCWMHAATGSKSFVVNGYTGS